ncbi:MAG: dual specificity protein phosphatase family protein [Oligoflexales bacterium]
MLSLIEKNRALVAYMLLAASIGFSAENDDSMQEHLRVLGLSGRNLCSIKDNDLRKAEFRSRTHHSPEILERAKQAIIETRNRLCVGFQDPMSIATKITDQIYLGPHTVARNKNTLTELGISSIISMTAECGIIFPEDQSLDYFFKGEDLIEHECDIENITDIIDEMYEFAEHKLKNPEEKIFVHCVQGKTRSAAAVTYILAKEKNISIKEAYEFVRGKRDINVPENWLNVLQDHLER